jgi:hypothetical protein
VYPPSPDMSEGEKRCPHQLLRHPGRGYPQYSRSRLCTVWRLIRSKQPLLARQAMVKAATGPRNGGVEGPRDDPDPSHRALLCRPVERAGAAGPGPDQADHDLAVQRQADVRSYRRRSSATECSPVRR